MGTNMAAGNQQKHLPLSFASKGIHKRLNNTFSDSRTVQIDKFLEISPFFNQHDCSLGRHALKA